MAAIPLEAVQRLDATDPLRAFKNEFELPHGVIYMDGNSLGALPRKTATRMAQVIGKEWGGDLINSWNMHGWMEAPIRVGDKIARLIGADSGEVVVADSTSVNLYKCLAAALQLTGERRVILSEAGNFPTDLYVAQGLLRSREDRWQLELREPEQILSSIDERVAVVLLTHVHYKTAHVHDMAQITRRAHERGAIVIWDLCHSVGALQIELNAAGADFAVGCGYKHLNGGPGSPAFIYVAKRHQEKTFSPLAGWLGHARPFDFIDQYEPAPGISRFLCGSPPLLGIMALEVGVDLALAADPRALQRKLQTMTELFIDRVEETCGEVGLSLVGPRDGHARGAHVSFHHPNAYAIVQNLIARGVIGDFRAPAEMRFGLTPLYLSYEDVWRAAEHLSEVLHSASWDQERFRRRQAVT